MVGHGVMMQKHPTKLFVSTASRVKAIDTLSNNSLTSSHTLNSKNIKSMQVPRASDDCRLTSAESFRKGKNTLTGLTAVRVVSGDAVIQQRVGLQHKTDRLLLGKRTNLFDTKRTVVGDYY